MTSTLISAADLASHTCDPQWLIVDCRFDLAQPAAGEAAYTAGHLPNAVYAHLDRDLAGPITATSGRHPLPAPDQLAATLSSWGLTDDTQVVAYDADTGAYAARLWWLLRWAGHRKVAVLDGGLKAWSAAGLPVTTDIAQRAPTRFKVHPDRSLWLDVDEVAERVRRSDWRLLDARGAERYAGSVEPIDRVAGHVPGALNHPFALNLAADGHFLPAQELRARFEKSQAVADGTVIGDQHTIAMCGSGVTACHLLLGLEIAGKPGAKLYAGSWSEWIRDPARGVAKGDTP